jgi:hypothetical protein
MEIRKAPPLEIVCDTLDVALGVKERIREADLGRL